jgi:sulfur carrier protein
MKVLINGEPQELRDGTTLAALIAERLPSDRGVAAAIDGEVAPRATWPTVILHDGQAIELLTAVQGG